MTMGDAHSDPIAAFRDAMRENGIEITGPIIGDGKVHRYYVEGDRRGVKNGWAILHLDERPAGAFGTMKNPGEKITWSMKGAKPLSAEEKRALREKAAADLARREAELAVIRAKAAEAANEVWNAAAPADNAHPYLQRKGVESYGLRVATWRREFGHDRMTGEVRETVIPNALLIPMRDARKEIHSLQAVFPNKENQLKRDKDFLAGGAKRGLWYAIGKPVEHSGRKLAVICEGYATAASIHAATGFGVIVAFDAGNLQPVTEAVRKIMPAATILIAADNDLWSKVGDVENPGVTRALEAGKAVGALVCIPVFADASTKPTDFNDLHALEGIDEVRRQIVAVLEPPAPADETPDPEEPPPHEEPPPEIAAAPAEPPAPAKPPARAPRASRPPPAEDDDTDADGPKADAYFRVLGHDRDHIFVYSQEKKMVIRRSETGWSKDGLFSIAPLQWWEMYFQGERGLAKDAAVNWLMRVAFKKGFYDPSKSRGRGAWMDDSRIVYHFGNQLAVNGETMDVTAIKSQFVYEQGRHLPLPSNTALTDAEGRQLLAITKQFRWTRPASAVLLAGAVALAPICGALKWRPHTWITGGQGTGKSTVLNDFVHTLMGGTAIFAQGNSTEAGIRQTLGNDALPVLFDETEQNDEREQMRVQSCLALIRQASTESEARTLKGTTHGAAMHFMVRSMFFLSSIQVGIRHQADYARISILSLKGSVGGEAEQASWKKLESDLAAMNADKDLPARLVRRTLNLLPTTLQNIATFTQAAAAKFGSQREGDQYGALLAGAWSLASSRLATLDEALDAIDRYDWSEYRENSEQDESNKALSAILSALIRMPRGESITVHELACRAAGRSVDTVDTTPAVAEAVLRRHGMAILPNGSRPEDATLLVSNNSTELHKLIAGTPFAADLRGQLLRVKGAEKHAAISFNGVKDRCVSIPMSAIIGDEPAPRLPMRDPADDEVPF